LTLPPSSSKPSRKMTSGPRMSMIPSDLVANATAMKPDDQRNPRL
jgi:hypothetical protein